MTAVSSFVSESFLNPSEYKEAQEDSYKQESWHWDSGSCSSPDVLLSTDRTAAYFHTDPVTESMRTAGVRGDKQFWSGEHYWEICFLEPPAGTSMMVGVGTEKATLQTADYKYVDLLGMDNESWGLSYRGIIRHSGVAQRYCEPFYDRQTVIGVYLDLYRGTLTFYKNSKSMGVAFTGLNTSKGPLYPIVSSTATETELGVEQRLCRYGNLQGECCLKIIRSLKDKTDIDRLPLPTLVKNRLKLGV